MTYPAKLDFLAIGPQRTASTWLDQCLRAHPDLSLPKSSKETFYWDRHNDFPLSWYWSHFGEATPEQMIGEVGSTYFHAEGLPEKIQAHNPACKIIITLRNPIERTTSLKRHLTRIGGLNGERWEDAFETYPEEFGADFYRKNLTRWTDVFPKEHVLVLLTDDIKTDPVNTIARIAKALGIEPHEFGSANEQINVGADAKNPKLNRLVYGALRLMRRYRLHSIVDVAKRLGGRRLLAQEKSNEAGSQNKATPQLASRYESDITFVEDFLGRDLSHWRK